MIDKKNKIAESKNFDFDSKSKVKDIKPIKKIILSFAVRWTVSYILIIISPLFIVFLTSLILKEPSLIFNEYYFQFEKTGILLIIGLSLVTAIFLEAIYSKEIFLSLKLSSRRYIFIGFISITLFAILTFAVINLKSEVTNIMKLESIMLQSFVLISSIMYSIFAKVLISINRLDEKLTPVENIKEMKEMNTRIKKMENIFDSKISN